MDDRAVLLSLLRFDRPLSDLAPLLLALDPDGAPLATVGRQHIAGVLRRYATGSLDAATIEDWANLVESRADLEYEPGHEAVVADALFDLANPDIQGPLDTVCDDVLAALE